MKTGLDIHLGSPAWGCDFFDREEIIDDCWEKLKTNSIILSAPRRYGKSSIMLRLRDNPRPGFFPIYFELEDRFHLTEFLNGFVDSILKNDQVLMKKYQKRVSKFLRKIEEVSFLKLIDLKFKKDSEAQDDWRGQITRLISELLDEKKEQKLVFIFDEFPLMLTNFLGNNEKGKNEAVEVLHWLRSLRQDPIFLKYIRFVFGGSIGLEKVVSYLNASRTINDIDGVPIGPFKRETAGELLKQLFQAKEIAAGEKVIQKILDIVGDMIPIYLQIMIDATIKEAKNTGRQITPQLVQECYEKRVHGPEYRRYFEDYYERLCRYYSPEDSKCSKRILRELANADDGITCSRLFQIYAEEMGSRFDKDKFEILLAALESDFYIERDLAKEKVYFRNRWLKDWWRLHHGL
ncbi:MAG: hypothetical protein L0Y73_08890 [Candidatus Aminicenantes bacterium]|nr:hypothetical protein [Candidatus Aminicenantes bacterium]